MLNATSLAAGVGVAVKNMQFLTAARNLGRKILILATFDPAKTTVVPLFPIQVLSAEDAGSRFGFGFMAHRLAVQAFKGGQGVPVFILPIEEAGGAAAATGSVNFTGSSGVGAGTLALYIAGLPVRIAVTAAMTASQIATAVVAAITADKLLPVTAAVDGVTPGKVNLTSKSKGPWGNKITVDFNLGLGEVLPVGVTAVVTAMSGGTGVPSLTTALESLGLGDDANEAYFTDVVHGFGQDTTALDNISTYVGAGNEVIGLYGKTVGRPFRCLSGDTAAGSSGLAALIAITDTRKLDRANGVVSVPGSANHPAEIAAQVIGHMARINQDRVAQSYIGIPLIDIHPGAKADRWTSDYDNRDTAVKSGISPTRVQNGVVYLQNVVSFYRPDDVAVESNGYRSMRNIGILQNILANVRANFEREEWQGITIVRDVAMVTNPTDRLKARDTDAVIDSLVALVTSFEGRAWLYEAAFSITELKKAGAVVIRPGGLGFDNTLSLLLSGEGGILDTTVAFDTSLTVAVG